MLLIMPSREKLIIEGQLFERIDYAALLGIRAISL